ncbi:hypothetical protein TRVL_08257 [Trypanosoma vivax]|nr:hypothetical protein TRVL_08257 [Trypanosoma vivax]
MPCRACRLHHRLPRPSLPAPRPLPGSTSLRVSSACLLAVPLSVASLRRPIKVVLIFCSAAFSLHGSPRSASPWFVLPLSRIVRAASSAPLRIPSFPTTEFLTTTASPSLLLHLCSSLCHAEANLLPRLPRTDVYSLSIASKVCPTAPFGERIFFRAPRLVRAPPLPPPDFFHGPPTLCGIARKPPSTTA